MTCAGYLTMAIAIALTASGTRAAHGGDAEHKILWGHTRWAAHGDSEHAKQGFIGGSVVRCPGCEIEVLVPPQGVVQTMELASAENTYASAWLEPGDYTLRVSADGWPMLILPGIRVEAGSATHLSLAFLVKQPRPKSTAPPPIPLDIETLPEWRPPSVPQAPMRHFKAGFPWPKEVKPGDNSGNDNKNKSNRKKNSGKKKGRKGKKNRRNTKGVKIRGR